MGSKDCNCTVTLDMARKIIRAAEDEASANGWNMVIVVVDNGGHMVAMERMEGAMLGAIKVAQAKASTAILFKRPTKAYDDAMGNEYPGPRLLSNPEICPFEGGVPIMLNDQMIGAVGVSGSTPPDDGQVAEAGAKAISG